MHQITGREQEVRPPRSSRDLLAGVAASPPARTKGLVGWIKERLGKDKDKNEEPEKFSWRASGPEGIPGESYRMNARDLAAALKANPRNTDLLIEAANYLHDQQDSIDPRPKPGYAEVYYVSGDPYQYDPRLSEDDLNLWEVVTEVERRLIADS